MTKLLRRAAAAAPAALALLACASAGAAPSARPAEGRLHVPGNTEYSTNWSGYAALKATFTNVEGSWVEPAGNCSGARGRQLSIASFWVGLDGWESGTVEQTGTDVDCEGSQEYQVPWHELYPQRAFAISQEVRAGDQMSVRVTQESLRLEDVTRKWHYEESFLPNYAYSSAEWIAEAPTNRLTDFGTVQFSSASASSGSASGAISAWSYEASVMVSRGGKTLIERARPGPLTGGGRSFSIEWLHS